MVHPGTRFVLGPGPLRHTRHVGRLRLSITIWIGSLGDLPHFEKDEAHVLRESTGYWNRRVDGLTAFSEAYYHHFPEFVKARMPVVVIDHYSTVADSVETDEEQATAVVADHLLDLGHQRIACLSSRETPCKLGPSEGEASLKWPSGTAAACASGEQQKTFDTAQWRDYIVAFLGGGGALGGCQRTGDAHQRSSGCCSLRPRRAA